MEEARVIEGYHGTDIESAEAILTHGFKISQNEYDWLGDGVYFFQEAPKRAALWANAHKEQPAVIGAEISLEGCLDLLDIGWASMITEAYNSFMDLYKLAGNAVPKQTAGAHRLDRYVLNYAIEVLEKGGIHICSVRAAFGEGSPVFPNSALLDLAHVQVAVRDLKVIKKTWLEVL